jgi:mutator protein MutT
MVRPAVTVGVALLWNQTGDRLLISQRSPGSDFAGYWEFPGGKVLPGESIADCIRREVEEELGVVVSVGPLLLNVTHAYDHKTVTLAVHHCQVPGGAIPEPRQCQAVCWVAVADLASYQFPAANSVILQQLGQGGCPPWP